MLDPLRFLGLRQRRDRLVERDRDRAALARVDRDLLRRAVDVTGGARPLLALAAVHRHLHDVAIGALERLVLVDQRLDGIGAGRDVVDAVEREADRRSVNGRRRSRPQSIDVDAEDQLARDAVVDLKPRFTGARILGEHDQQASVDRLRAGRPGERDAEAQRPALSDGLSGRRRDQDRDGEQNAA